MSVSLIRLVVHRTICEMGRAPNPGAPQRVSAHVVPKAPSFPSDDEDEKTTIESGWEEEASTTVEQGEVAEKIRALGLGLEPRRPNTSVTSTTGSGMTEEPTVDDPRASAALALLPPPVTAQLVVTQGTDAGQALEVRPGKTYTIGRGVDNDLVLSDIAVSRKHFDIRHDNGAWIVADRGSGNGTLVNNRIEDAPFQLASGDVIEVGNTAFRFDVPNGVPRAQPSYDSGASTDEDDGELSTVSGKPLSEAALVKIAAAVSRPKTLPPPAPLQRPRTQTGRPPGSYASDRSGPASLATQPLQPQPAPLPPGALAAALAPTLSPLQALQALPLPQMANRPPLAPTALGDPPPGALPTTLPGQGPPRPARLPFSYPSVSDMPPLLAAGGPRPPMLVTSAQPGRDATSTAQVPPMSYSNAGPAIVPPQAHRAPPPAHRRVKMMLGAAAIVLFAAVVTIAIVTAATRGPALEGPPPAVPAVRPSVVPIEPPSPVDPPRPDKLAPSAATTPASVPRPDKLAAAPSLTTPPATAPSMPPATLPARTTPSPIGATVPSPVTATRPATTTPPPALATSPPATTTTTPSAAGRPTPSTSTAPSVAMATTPAAPVRPDKPESTPPRGDKPERTPRQEAASPGSPRADKKAPKRPDKKPDKKALAVRAEPERSEVAAPRVDKKHIGRTVEDVKSDASSLYRVRKFSAAAASITAALSSFSGADLRELKNLVAIYTQFGRAYSIGMNTDTKPTEAFVLLGQAADFDRELGAAFAAEIRDRLLTVSLRAASFYLGLKQYDAAFKAVRQAERLGGNASSSSTLKLIRDNLEARAAELVRSANADIASDPEAAKVKLRQVLGMVDPKTVQYVRATKLLNGL